MLMFMSVHVIFVGVFVMMIVIFVVVVMFMRMLMRMFVVIVIMVMMLMHVLIFFDTVYDDMRMRAFDAALDALFELIGNTGNTNRIKLYFAGLYVAGKLSQRCEKHVSCSAHIAFDIKSLHGLTSDVVDHAGRISCTESVVDINDRDAARA